MKKKKPLHLEENELTLEQKIETITAFCEIIIMRSIDLLKDGEIKFNNPFDLLRKIFDDLEHEYHGHQEFIAKCDSYKNKQLCRH